MIERKSKAEITAMRQYVRGRTRWALTPEDCLLIAMFGSKEQQYWATVAMLLKRLCRLDARALGGAG